MTLKNEKGFTLVELMVAMVVFVFAMIAATNTFMPLVNQFKQQGKITETQVEGIIGLDMLRMDIECAGFGLPWLINDIDNNGNLSDDWDELNYQESDNSKSYNLYDDTGNAPRAILVGNDVGADGTLLGINNSDYLVIKAVNVRLDDEAQKWSYTYMHPDTGFPVSNAVYEWKDGSGAADNTKNMANSTKVIALKPSQNDEYYNILITEQDQLTGAFIKYYDTFKNFDDVANLIKPFDPAEIFVLYGIGPDNSLRMPFNRADYYISNPATSSVPGRCAAGTGVLHKGIISHNGGLRTSGPLPLLDCVADMQVIAGLDTDLDGTVDNYSDSFFDPVTAAPLTTPTAVDIRNQIREVRIYILMHEGQRDPNYNYPNPTIDVGEFGLGKTGGGSFNFAAEGITDWQNYRWKVHTMVIKPDNLNPNN